MGNTVAVEGRMARAGRPVSDFLTGIGLLARGLGSVARSPGLLLLGMLPALITFVLLVAGFVTVLAFLSPESHAVTWFANGWPAGGRELVRALAQIAIVGVYVLVSIVAFTGITLAIGDPFYEKISERIEDRLGGLRGAVDRPWWRELGRGIVESIRLVTLSIVIGTALFFAGLLPGIGQTVVPVIGALVGGWALAVELTGVAFARRGLRLRDRRRVLRRHRWLTLGFGVAVFVCFLIPLGAVLLMPAAVAGATLLTRQVHGQPI